MTDRERFRNALMGVFEEEGRRQRAGESHLGLREAIELALAVAGSFVATTPEVESPVLRELFVKLAEAAIDDCIAATERVQARKGRS